MATQYVYEGLVQLNEMETVFCCRCCCAVENNDLVIWH